ncbi:Cleft lip and palate transmembrane protein 1 like protein [Podochytrium sp. JEL0797]|nr:Cleft lip and palate transmembrane protein 1 like protein [Podochytrium sp. JEL0797]
MAEPAAPPAAPPEENSFFANTLQSMVKMAVIYYGMQWMKGSFNKAPATGPNMPTQVAEDGSTVPVQAVGDMPKPANYIPLWQEKGALLDLHVYLAPEDDFHSFGDVSKLIWKQQNLAYGNVSDVRLEEITLDLSPEVQRNGSLYAHMYLTHKGNSPNPEAKTYVEDKTLYFKKLLTRYQKKHKVVVKKSLIKKSADPVVEAVVDDSDPDQWVSYWWHNLTICMVGDIVNIPSSVPPPILAQVDLADDGLHYYPIFYADDFWLLADQLQPINETLKSVNLTLKWESKTFWYFQLVTMMEDSFKQQVGMMGADGKETDEMKRMFSDTNPILLGITFAVSMLHSLFDFLAFKNDITFWKDKKNMEGMSFRTIVMNVAFQFIIFLYLMDNETSWMILFSNGVGLLIEAWKINKTVDVKRKDEFPYVKFVDKYKPSKLARKTRKYDEMAFQYLAYALYPLLAGYTIYSAVYEEHKGWYSFIVGTLVGFVYMFGFINMTPQLFINYKLKSVAHMPWKTFMYKSLNTFIDDLFAFVIKMPWLHRVACLRDDLVFFVYLYQRWIYPEDKRRRNEFGQVGDAEGANDSDFDDLSDDEEDEKEKAEKKEKGAAAVVEGVETKIEGEKQKEEATEGVKSRKAHKAVEEGEKVEEKAEEWEKVKPKKGKKEAKKDK